MFKFLLISSVSIVSFQAQAADLRLRPPLAEVGGVKVDIAPEYSDRQFDWNEWMSEKFLEPLNAKQAGILKDNTLYISGQLRGSFVAEKTNVANKFPLLSRFPAQHSGTTGSRFILNNAILGFTANAGEWTTITTEIMATDIEYPGQSTMQMRRAFVTFGNLKNSPLYFGFGKNFVDFGDNGSFTPFTHTMNNHYFQTQSDTPVAAVGYSKNGLHVVATAIQGGRQLRVADSPSSAHVNNFALNATKTFELGEKTKLKVGAGYLNNTIYNTLVPHHTVAQAAGQVKSDNPAFDVNSTLTYGQFDLMGEYAQTVNKWNASDHIVQAMTMQARYRAVVAGYNTAFSGSWGKGVQGASGTNFEQMTQVVGGVQVKVNKHMSVGAEYLFAKGFVPLMDLRKTGDQNVQTHTFITGARVHF